jgi:hypothetical protein
MLVAAILAHVEQSDIAKHPTLANELAHVAALDVGPKQKTTTGLLFALDNCRQVLESCPLVVNQSCLDRLMLSLLSIASFRSELMTDPDTVEQHTLPLAAHVYERLCSVVGAILGRHRRRLSDRYHLLVPVLQALLRCLFWPGQRVVESQRGASANAIATFARALPKWMTNSAEPLPLASADQLTRLLSSICNPTVSAARTSATRRNELNDEVKQARKLAGQHMQYFIQEYCRCVLDGQLAPDMKNRLLTGLYKIMDAVDRDLMRAVNAGMDPSSRAIFKDLYSNWTKYGRWDKS